MQGSVQEQPVTVARRVLDIEDYVDILRRHRPWIIGPAFLGLVAGVVIAFLWPDTFLASGQLRVVPPRVPSRLVASNMTEEMSQRVNAIYQGIVSRTNLNNLISTYNLYPDKRKRLPMEDVVDDMRKDIVISPLRGMSSGAAGRSGSIFAFTVSYAYSDRRLATKVCSELISKFMEESVTSRSSQSQETTMFFKEESDAAKQTLDDLDTKLTAFKTANAGTLPDEANSLMMSVSAVESSIQNLNMSISRTSGEKIQLESQLRYLRDQLPASQPQADPGSPAAAPSTPVVRDERLAQLDGEVTRLESSVAALRENYKETHPDMQRALALLSLKKKERDQYAAKLASLKPGEAPPSRSSAAQPRNAGARELQGRISVLQASVQAKEMEIEDLNRQLEYARNRSKNLQAKVEASPLARSNYMNLMRDREGAAQRYEDLQKRLQESSMATNLETRKQGETLEILEQPVIPTEPNAPKRPIIITISAIAGLLLGMGLAFGRELRDMSLKSLKDVRAYTRLTVLGSIPLLENDFVVRRRRRMAWLGWSAAFLIGVLLMSGAIIYYYTAKS